jgi:hypothetical protein
MTAIFPSLPGLAWSVTKAPRFATRIQRAVSGRELRILDQPYPIWTWTLSYSLLRDKWDARGPGGLGAGYDELRTIANLGDGSQVSLFKPFLFAIAVGDTFTLLPGCDHTTSACQNLFDNLARYGGFPYIPPPESAA